MVICFETTEKFGVTWSYKYSFFVRIIQEWHGLNYQFWQVVEGLNGVIPFESILLPHILGLFWDLVILDLLKLGKYIRDT